MKRLLLPGLLGLALLPASSRAQTTFVNPPGQTFNYINNGTVNTPQIDAINFINNGNFFSSTILPFETANTLNYTNTGLMIGSSGFIFDKAPVSVGLSTFSRSFYNGFAASVQASLFLYIRATNVVNLGSLNISASGVMDLQGVNVNLAESQLQVPSISGGSGGVPTVIVLNTNQFIPEVGIYDQDWGATNFDNQHRVNLATLWTTNSTAGGFMATAPNIPGFFPPNPTQPGVPGFSIPTFISTNLIADSVTNVIDTTVVTLTNMDLVTTTPVTLASNIVRQAVFLLVPPGFAATIGFQGGAFKTAAILLSLPTTNSVTSIPETNFVFFQDTLASEPGRGVLLNAATLDTYRPTNYLVAREGFLPGAPGNNGFPSTNFFFVSGNQDYAPIDVGSEFLTNNVITNNGSYSAYTALIDNVASRPPNVFGGTFTNLPGSVRITAGNLDLSDTRIAAQGQVSIHTTHLISSAGASIDCDNLSFDLGSTNGSLTFQDLANGFSAGRIRGNLRAWSGFWTNTVYVILPNNFVTNMAAGGSIPQPVTNAVTVVYHALIVDASSLEASIDPTTFVYDLSTHGTDITIKDDINLVESMFFDTRTLTLQGNLNLPGFFPLNPITGVTAPGVPIRDWISTNAPHLLFFTNNGFLSIPNTAHFGDDRPRYSAFVNGGTISANSIQINSAYFENHSNLVSAGLLNIQFDSGLLTNGNSSSGSDAKFTGTALTLNNYTLASGRALDFSLTTLLSDSGSNNTLLANNGVNLRIKPAFGDLLGTTITNLAPALSSQIQTIDNVWAGEDRGTSPEGFGNNAAIGKLVLAANSPNAKFRFTGAGAQNAMYVDLIEFDNSVGNTNSSGNLTNILIGPNMHIYYAQAIANGVSIAEQLNGKFGSGGVLGGRFTWVSNYAGIFSGTNLVSGGTTNRFNQALAESKTLDSNSNSIPNFQDPNPIPTNFIVNLVVPGPGSPFLPFTPPTAPQSSPGFGGAKGSYNGLFYEADEVAPQTSGYFTASTTDKGKFSAKVLLGSKNYSFSGQFNSLGRTTNAIPKSTLTAQLQLDLTGGNQITGEIIGSGWTAELLADRATFNKKSNKTPAQGNYTIVIPGFPGDSNSPAGSGFGTVNVDASGGLKWSATLGDGSKVSQKSALSSQGFWPLYAALYKGSGILVGWIQFSDQIETDLEGQTVWIKPVGVAGSFYPAGFSNETQTVGSRYKSPPNLTQGVAVFTDGNLSAGVTNAFKLGKGSKVSDQGTNKFSLKFTTSTGLFSGSILKPGGGKLSFGGALLEKSGVGAGFFKGTNQTGQVLLTPP